MQIDNKFNEDFLKLAFRYNTSVSSTTKLQFRCKALSLIQTEYYLLNSNICLITNIFFEIHPFQECGMRDDANCICVDVPWNRKSPEMRLVFILCCIVYRAQVIHVSLFSFCLFSPMSIFFFSFPSYIYHITWTVLSSSEQLI